MSPRKIIRRREVIARTGYSYSSIWRKEREGTFPASVKLSETAIGWYEDEVDRWIHDRVRGRARQVPTAA
jgi:prophage regulatory protein